MEEIITDEYIRFKAGFLDGKQEVFRVFALGGQIYLDDLYDSRECLDEWYSRGFKCGIDTFYGIIEEQSKSDVNTQELIKKSFTEEVVKLNQEEKQNIPIGKFKM